MGLMALPRANTKPSQARACRRQGSFQGCEADRALATPSHIFCGLFQVTERSSETSFFACSWFRFSCLVAVSRHDPGLIFVTPLWTHTGWVFGFLRLPLPTAGSPPVPSSFLLHPREDPLQGALLVHSSWGAQSCRIPPSLSLQIRSLS